MNARDSNKIYAAEKTTLEAQLININNLLTIQETTLQQMTKDLQVSQESNETLKRSCEAEKTQLKERTTVCETKNTQLDNLYQEALKKLDILEHRWNLLLSITV